MENQLEVNLPQTKEWESGEGQFEIEIGRENCFLALKAGYEQLLRTTFLPIPPKAAYLEAGAGRGYLVKAVGTRLPELFNHTFHLDISFPALQEARERKETALKVTESSFAQADLLSLPFSGDSLDGVFSLSVYDVFSPSDLEKGLREVQRTLKPKGKVLFIHDVAPHPNSFEFEEEQPALWQEISRRFLARYKINPDELKEKGIAPILLKIAQGFQPEESDKIKNILNFTPDSSLAELSRQAAWKGTFHWQVCKKFLNEIDMDMIIGGKVDSRYLIDKIKAQIAHDIYTGLLKHKLAELGFQNIKEITQSEEVKIDREKGKMLDLPKGNRFEFFLGARRRETVSDVSEKIYIKATQRAIVAEKK